VGMGTFLDHHGIIIHNAWGYELIAYPTLMVVMYVLLYEIIGKKPR
jgi:hypothetical protein